MPDRSLSRGFAACGLSFAIAFAPYGVGEVSVIKHPDGRSENVSPVAADLMGYRPDDTPEYYAPYQRWDLPTGTTLTGTATASLTFLHAATLADDAG